jgi:hypothetical protein
MMTKNPLQSPTSNFNAVRDGRNAPDFYFDIPLNAAGEVTYPIAGNSFYVDANPSDGNAIAYFQDTNLDRTPTPFYISPGFIAQIPFTQCRFVWAAQPGKKIRIVYGTDTLFQPGSVSQVSFAGVVSINDAITTGIQSARSVLSGTAFTSATLLAAASNVAGITVKSAQFLGAANASASTEGSLIAATTIPTNFSGGASKLILLTGLAYNNGSGNISLGNLSRFIPAGYGLYHIHQSAAAGGGTTIEASWQ